MIWNRLLYGIALLGSVLFFAFYDGWFSTFFLVFLLIMPIFSLLVSLPAVHGFRLSLNVPAVVEVDDPARLIVRAAAPMPIPRFRLRLRLIHSISGESMVLSRKKTTKLPTNHCGQLEIITSKIGRYDYLGLFRFPVRDVPTARILVRPKPEVPGTVPNLQTLPAPRLIPKPSGSYSEIHELREYRPGDSLRTIHWKASAKTDKLIVREPMEPAEAPAVLTADLQGAPWEIDSILGQLLWLSDFLLEHDMVHEIRVRTGSGIICRKITCQEDTRQAVDALLGCPATDDAGSLKNAHFPARWRYHVFPAAQKS